MEPIKKKKLDRNVFRVPVNVKDALETEMTTYDMMQVMGNTINEQACHGNAAIEYVENTIITIDENENERIANEEERRKLDDKIQQALDGAYELAEAEREKRFEEAETSRNESVERAEASTNEAKAAAEAAAMAASGAQESASKVEESVANLEEAIQQLPDGQAVSAQVAQNTVDIAKKAEQSDLNDLALDVKQMGYYICDSASNEKVKSITIGDGHRNGMSTKVKMLHATSVACVFSLNGVSHPMFFEGKIASADNTWSDGDVLELFCDGVNTYSKRWYAPVILSNLTGNETSVTDTVSAKSVVDYAAKKTELNSVRQQLDSQIDDIEATKNEAIEQIQESFSSQKVTTDMLSESTKQYIEASGGGTITNFPDEDDLTVNDGKLSFRDKITTSYREIPIYYAKGTPDESGRIQYSSRTFQKDGVHVVDSDYYAGGQTVCNASIEFLFNSGIIHNSGENRTSSYLCPPTINVRNIEEVGERNVILKNSDGSKTINYIPPIFARGRVRSLNDGLCSWMTNLSRNNFINVVEAYGIDNTGMKDVTDELNAIFAMFKSSQLLGVDSNKNFNYSYREKAQFARDEGIVFYFPRGIYRVSGTLIPYRNINIIGEYYNCRRNAENFALAGTTFLFLPRSEGKHILFSKNVIGTSTYVFGLHNISVVCDCYSVNYTSEEHVYRDVDNTPNRECIAAEACIVEDCQFQGFNKCALNTLQFSEYRHVSISKCKVAISTISDTGYTGDLVLSDSLIRECKIGCEFGPNQWNVIRNSWIEELTGYGIYADSTSKIEMIGVHMNHIYNNAIRVNSPVGIIISGCALNRCGTRHGSEGTIIGKKGDAYSFLSNEDKKDYATICCESIKNSSIDFTQSNAILGEHTNPEKLPSGKTPEDYRCMPVPIVVNSTIVGCNISISEFEQGQANKSGTRLVVVSLTNAAKSTDNFILDNGKNYTVLDASFRG